jgi:hypothetical protein
MVLFIVGYLKIAVGRTEVFGAMLTIRGVNFVHPCLIQCRYLLRPNIALQNIVHAFFILGINVKC